jgi:hypothetical protein
MVIPSPEETKHRVGVSLFFHSFSYSVFLKPVPVRPSLFWTIQSPIGIIQRSY